MVLVIKKNTLVGSILKHIRAFDRDLITSYNIINFLIYLNFRFLNLFY